MNDHLSVLFGVVISVILTGCATVPLEESFRDVERQVQDEHGFSIRWNGVTGPADAGTQAVNELLADGLTPEEATRIALLNNTRLQAIYEQFGIARAELVGAGLPANPVFRGELLYESGSSQSWELEIAEEFLSVLLIPLRRAVAKDALEQARIQVVIAVIDVAMDTRRAFYHYQADAQAFDLLKNLLLAEETAFEMAVKMREAGVLPLSDLAAAQKRYETVKLTYSAAELDLEASRERVNRLMGLYGSASSWVASIMLAEAPAENTFPADYERRAVEQSLDLASAWQEIKLAARRSGVNNVEAIFSEIEVGAGFESEEPGSGGRRWEVGPVLSVPIPLFNQGQAVRAVSRSEVRRKWDIYTAVAVELRSASRAAAHRVNVSREMALYRKHVILAVARQEMEQAQLRYNGMLIGSIQLLRKKQEEIEAEAEYVGALLQYWLARADLEQILMGRLIIRAPEDRPDIIGANVQRASANGEGGH